MQEPLGFCSRLSLANKLNGWAHPKSCELLDGALDPSVLSKCPVPQQGLLGASSGGSGTGMQGGDQGGRHSQSRAGTGRKATEKEEMRDRGHLGGLWGPLTRCWDTVLSRDLEVGPGQARGHGRAKMGRSDLRWVGGVGAPVGSGGHEHSGCSVGSSGPYPKGRSGPGLEGHWSPS